MSKPVLIFGGSFDPPTIAHRVQPSRVAEMIDADRIVYVPAAISPHKLEQPPLDPSHRLAMLKLAIKGLPETHISTVELDRDGPSYMIDTLRSFRSGIEEAHPLRLLIGDDQAMAFNRWKDWREILELAEPIVMPRLHPTADSMAKALASEGGWRDEEIRRWIDWRIDLPIMDVEATIIRERIARQEQVDDLLAPEVLAYIMTNRLYSIID